VVPSSLEDVDAGGTIARRRWRTTYVRRLVASDAGCAVFGATAGYLVRFGPSDGVAPASMWIAITLPAVWLFAMLVARTYEERFLWRGPDEFRRIFFAAAMLLALIGTVSWAAHLEIARGLVVVALPLTTAATLADRELWRSWTRRQHRRGRLLQRTLLVGHRGAVSALQAQMNREPGSGYQLVGCCLPVKDRPSPNTLDGLPVLGDLDDVVHVVRRFEIDTVAVLPSTRLDGARLRQLGWDLESTPAELLVAPAVTEVAGPRVHIQPVCGLPLLHMDRPELRGVRRVAKNLLDRSGAALALLITLPVLLIIALSVKVTSNGPVLFGQERVGKGGRRFRMLKFRTMVPDAEERLADLLSAADGNGVLFKLRNDPRLTPIGRVLRRYSLDELPQLVNVLIGSMSLVGPRPPLPSEVAQYGADMHRRFLVKPGLTGLWQISGRSDLGWEDSVRIDLLYVENWSLGLDLMILWRTLGAVARGEGAY
jgi:exopolysaccharide biosynthesis polyprenyl glycosylphosphotransferase